ncbi:hypothetical protein TCE0_022r06548 [Talaromyces pinophilus]|uniref:Thioredoxin domain-containing protein n=1 Tax=Talaromyces pinophilus TaxID=128442 RepID=A0A6V8HA48_TALPI|nr:hypothetical protein TCE0_022r06548 [Talaromyces pinophilus]
MKSSLLAWSLFSLSIAPSLATNLYKRQEETDEVEDGPTATIFNGIEVPPEMELNPDNFKTTIADGYWFVKHFSPSCPHCQDIAPTWQTLYEFYYTSDPLSSSSAKSPDTQSSLNSFTGYYDFHFAEMNCLAYRDLCVQLDVKYFPTFSLYHDGELVEQYTGKKDMQGLSDFIEERLEQIRPGSRPAGGLKLPEPGADSVDKFVTRTRDPWFVKFYAPWCHHCQALAPPWLTMAKEMKGKLNVGEVNCDIEKRLCKDAGVKGYPTMFFFKGGEKVEYEGLRGVGDLIRYAQTALDTGAGVKYVDASTFKEMEETGDVIFLYFFDKATTSEDFAALEQLALPLVGHARLVKTDSKILADRFKISTWPRLLVVRDGRPTYFNALAPYDMRDNPRVLEWMRSHWLPIVPELTASNAKEIMQNKYVVLGILSHKRSDEFRLGQAELKNAALEWMDKQTQLFRLERQELRDSKQLRIEEAEDRDDQRALRAAKSMHINIREEDKKQVAFAWVDGDFWDRWLRTTYGIDVKDGERVIINDEDNRRYWDSTSSGANIMPSRTSILETIPLVISDPPKLRSKSTIGFFEATFFHTWSFITNHPVWSAIILVISSIAAYIAHRRRILRRGVSGYGGSTGGGILGYGTGTGGNVGGGFFRLDGKEGLLNGGSAGKVD